MLMFLGIYQDIFVEGKNFQPNRAFDCFSACILKKTGQVSKEYFMKIKIYSFCKILIEYLPILLNLSLIIFYIYFFYYFQMNEDGSITKQPTTDPLLETCKNQSKFFFLWSSNLTYQLLTSDKNLEKLLYSVFFFFFSLFWTRVCDWQLSLFFITNVSEVHFICKKYFCWL